MTKSDPETILKPVQDMVQADGNIKYYKIHPDPPLQKEGIEQKAKDRFLAYDSK